MCDTGICSLIIRAHDLNFDELKENLPIEPSRIVKKGQSISRAIEESKFDIWIFEMKYSEELPNQALEKLLAALLPYKSYLRNVSQSVDIRIKCYVQSRYAQINFEIFPELIKELASIGIKLEISILSWGEVKV